MPPPLLGSPLCSPLCDPQPMGGIGVGGPHCAPHSPCPPPILCAPPPRLRVSVPHSVLGAALSAAPQRPPADVGAERRRRFGAAAAPGASVRERGERERLAANQHRPAGERRVWGGDNAMGRRDPQGDPAMGQRDPQGDPAMGQRDPKQTLLWGRGTHKATPLWGRGTPKETLLWGRGTPKETPLWGRGTHRETPLWGRAPVTPSYGAETPLRPCCGAETHW